MHELGPVCVNVVLPCAFSCSMECFESQSSQENPIANPCLVLLMTNKLIAEIGDLAVDWLNHKLYWTDQNGGRIEERDLNTNERRTIVDSSDTETAAFNGIAMYPFPNFG